MKRNLLVTAIALSLSSPVFAGTPAPVVCPTIAPQAIVVVRTVDDAGMICGTRKYDAGCVLSTRYEDGLVLRLIMVDGRSSAYGPSRGCRQLGQWTTSRVAGA